VIAGGSAGRVGLGPALELAALLLNVTLGAFDGGLLDETAAVEPSTPAEVRRSRRWSTQMRAGAIEDAHRGPAFNPVYTPPAPR